MNESSRSRNSGSRILKIENNLIPINFYNIIQQHIWFQPKIKSHQMARISPNVFKRFPSKTP